MRKFYALFLLLSSTTIFSWAQQKTWTGGNGNWNDASNWTPQAVPVANDLILFNTGSSVTISNVPSIVLGKVSVTNGSVILLQTNSTNVITVADNAGEDFIIQQNSTLTLGANISLALQANATSDIAGTLSIGQDNEFTTGNNGLSNVRSGGSIHNAGTITSAAPSLHFELGSNYIHARNGGNIPLAGWDPASNITIVGIKNIRPGGLAEQEFGNVTWDSQQESDIDLDGTLRNIKGDLVIRKTSVQSSTAWYLNFSTISDFTLDIGGDLIIEQAATDLTSVCFINEGTGNAIVNVAGNYIHQDGNLLFVNVNKDESDGTAVLHLDGDFVQSGGDINFTEGINVGPAGLKGSMTIKGNFLQLAGAIRTTTGNDLIPNGLLTFNGPGVQTFRAIIPANITYLNYMIESGSTLRLESDLLIQRDEEDFYPNWMGKCTVKDGATLDASTFTIASQILDDLENPDLAYGEFHLSPGARIITSKSNGIEGTVPAVNNLRVNLSSEASYEFRGGSTGTFITWPATNTVARFIVNRPGDELNLAMPFTVAKELVLTNGVINSTPGNLLTIGDGATATPASTLSFVNGPLAKSGNTSFVFPVGKTGAGFRNIGISELSGSATFVAEFFRAQPPAGDLAASLVRLSSCEYWTLQKQPGADAVNARVTLSWEQASACGGPYVTDPTTLRVASFDGGSWEDEGRFSGTGNSISGTVISLNALTDFGTFALGSTTSANPLPVVFAGVKAIDEQDQVRIQWSNLTEQDVKAYRVERSADGVHFAAVGQIQPTGNDNTAASYTFPDAAPLTGLGYYRIQAVEANGHFVYSNIVSVDRSGKAEGLHLFPNPVVNQRMTLRVNDLTAGRYKLSIVNSVGQEVHRESINISSGIFSRDMDTHDLKPGHYILLLTNGSTRQVRKFTVQ
jgi:hypothetical protein